MKPWRQIACPHKDVLEGTFKQAEFAADISQVANGTALPFYQDAEKFFARTYSNLQVLRMLSASARHFGFAS